MASMKQKKMARKMGEGLAKGASLWGNSASIGMYGKSRDTAKPELDISLRKRKKNSSAAEKGARAMGGQIGKLAARLGLSKNPGVKGGWNP